MDKTSLLFFAYSWLQILMYKQVTPVIMLSQVILLLLLNTCTAEDTTKGHIKYMRPTNVTTCPPHTQPCHTLEQYVSNTSEYFKYTVFYFLSGLHDLHTHITIKDIVNVTLTSYSARCSTQEIPIAIATVIHCEQGVGSFGFFNITNLTIDNLKFVSCGNESKCSALLFNSVFNLNVSNLEVDNGSMFLETRLSRILRSSTIKVRLNQTVLVEMLPSGTCYVETMWLYPH